MLHAAVGLLVDEGRLDPDAPAAVPEWSADADPRGRVTLRQLLQMRDGLEWVEDYEDERISDVIRMLFGEGAADVAGFAARHGQSAPPGTRFNYSSGTSNLVARLVGDAVGRGEATRAFLADRLFAPLGMHDATVTLDDAGTFIGSSYVYCSARSYARFATLYLRGGVWEGRRLLSAAWVDDAQRPVSVDDAAAPTYYSHHWWLDGAGAYWASGYEGQRLVVSPSRDAVLVRLGRTPDGALPRGARLVRRGARRARLTRSGPRPRDRRHHEPQQRRRDQRVARGEDDEEDPVVGACARGSRCARAVAARGR